MEINHLLKDVINLNEYITATQDVSHKYMNCKVTINIATVLTLKKIRSLEIEYLNKCDENGVACIMFERLLSTPASKVWGVLAKELVYLLQYWLEAIRKHLINHSIRWWTFLKLILKFIKELRLKDPVIPNMLVELTAECLFDLATASRPDVFQRHEILHCLNMVCAESGREVRFAMRTKFGDYFVKLAALMATSSFLPCQYSSLECLLRWLVPRQERCLRAAAADRWFPGDLLPAAARTLFLNSSWMNFFQDARDFLNALNEGNGLVKSVVCRRLAIGRIVLINGTERQQTWLDINAFGKSLSVLLDPRVLQVFGVADHRACETLFIDDDITETALLTRESLGVTISLNTLRAPYIRPTDISTGDERRVSIVISSQVDLRSLDVALRSTFGDKYQLQMDLDTDMTQSPQRSYKNNNEFNSEEDTRFSHPVEVKKRKQSGYIVRKKNTGGSISPSTASTSSLVQLKDRLAALPRYKFDKEPVSVCAQPALSNVTEHTEQDDNSVYTVKYQPYGVCYKSKIPKPTEKKSRSEGETVKKTSRGGRGLLSPVVSDDNSTSLLLVATIGSNNDTTINDTVERLSKTKDYDDDNIINLIVQEALEANPKIEVSDSGINTDEKKSQEESEAIDDTPKELRGRATKNCTVLSKSTTDDESNTEAINDTPAFVSTRKNMRSFNKPQTVAEAEKQTFHVTAVEEFFSQHIAENERGQIVISPSLAKKINETSSETSESFDAHCLMNEDILDVERAIFDDIAVIDCVNDMVDKVCSDFEKCTEYLFKDHVVQSKTPKSKPLEIQRPKRNIKLKYKPVRKTKTRVRRKTKDTDQKNTNKMSTIIEQKEEDTFLEEIIPKTNDKNADVVKIPSPDKIFETPCAKNTTPSLRRKRKLYSPKDDLEKEIQDFTIEKTSDDVPLSKIKTRNNIETTATCYKELEKERKKYTRLPRSRKSKTKVAEMPSPRTLKMNSLFDDLKQTVESGEKITLVDKTKDVFNFTCESEDDDFKKKIDLKKRASTTTVESTTLKKGRNTRRVKESDSSYEEASKPKTVKRKKVTKRANKRTNETKTPIVDLVGKVDLVDEKMREAAREELNTSFIIEQSENYKPIDIEPTLKIVPQSEEIHNTVSNDTLKKEKTASKKNTRRPLTERVNESESNDTSTLKKRAYKRTIKKEVEHDDKSNDTTASQKKTSKRVNKKTDLLKKNKDLAKIAVTVSVDDDGTISPLPGLVVESMPKYKEDVNDSLTTKMLQKFKRIYKNGPDANDSANTQNMLSDVDRFNYSAQNCISIADDIFLEDKDGVEKSKNYKYKQTVQSKTTKGTRNKSTDHVEDIETVNMRDVNDNETDRSIPSDGINAHGDFEESPPNAETIKEVLQPRELQDMDQSMKDYFTKLTREIHNASKESSKSVEGEEVSAILRNKTEKRDISPIISIKRLSFENISKWMPSRRTSYSDSPQSSQVRSLVNIHSSNVINQELKSAENTPKSATKPETSTPESIKTKPTIAKISLEEFEKWLPMPKTFTDRGDTLKKDKNEDLKLVYRTRSKSKLNTQTATTIPKDVIDSTKTAKTNSKSKKIDTDSDDDINSNVTETRKIRRSKRNTRTHNATCDSDSDTETKAKGTGSTILQFKIPSTQKNAHEKRKIKKHTDSDEDDVTAKKLESKNDSNEYTKTHKNEDKPTISPIKLKNIANIESNSSDDECIKRIRTMFSTSNRNSLRASNIEPKSPRLERNTSHAPTEPKRRKIFEEQSKKRIEALGDVALTESGPSGSSVNDWFRRMEPIRHRDDDASMPYKDSIENIIEKLDTTLVEMNENTSKKFVNLFVEAHKSLSAQRDGQRALYKQIATDLICEMVRIMDEKFADLDRKSQAMGNDFMEELKKQAFELIRNDCKQKRAMVLILKEDVQAVMDHINRGRSTDSA